jgi:hypothetical protein
MPPTLFTRLRHWWARLQGGPSPGATTAAQAPAQLQGPAAGATAAADANPTPPVPYDEALLDRARTQWQFGDWESLAAITQEHIQHHPDRAKLALLAAAGMQQMGPLSQPGQRDGMDAVPCPHKGRGHRAPAPGTMPGTVHQEKIRHAARSSRSNRKPAFSPLALQRCSTVDSP